MAYYNEKIETMPKDELSKLQYQELKKLTARLYDTSPFYHKKMVETGVKPADISSIADITKLPFMKNGPSRQLSGRARLCSAR